jgi:protein involved in polysaccharide export with SLBB domain
MNSKIASDSSILRRSRTALHLLGLWALFTTRLSSPAADSSSVENDSSLSLPLGQSASAESLREEGRSQGTLFEMKTPRPAIDLAQTFAPLNFSVATNSPIAAGKSYLADEKYKLRAGDRVSLQIIEDRDPPKSLLVADSGELDIPYVGRISAVERTCKQLADDLKQQLEKDYYYHATVVIGLDVANKLLGRIYVWGQVRNQGPIDIALNENLTAGKAVLRAGGFAEFANKKKVKLIRNVAEAPNNKQVIELNMVAILEEGAVERDIVLQPDDLIVVPSRLINF